MSLQEVPNGERVQIGFFGRRNAGKSSLINAIASQEVSLVSPMKGTTTDPVRKSMELLPLGPVTLVDTAGFDDEGQLGTMRNQRTRKELQKMDIVVLVLDARNETLTPQELAFLEEQDATGTQVLMCITQVDQLPDWDSTMGELPKEKEKQYLPKNLPEKWRQDWDGRGMFVSANGFHIKEWKERLAKVPVRVAEPLLVADYLKPEDRVILVIPVDTSAPKGRLILPQQLVLRELLDHHMVPLCCQPEELPELLVSLREPPALVITDSQAFGLVSAMVPQEILMTSFSILMARYKGNLQVLLQGVQALRKLTAEDGVLISEGCTHHRQCNDIGTVKIPHWIQEFTGVTPKFTYTSGGTFPEDVTSYRLVIHCGACMLTAKEMQHRMQLCQEQQVPMVNYGMAIAAMHGILDRSLEIFGVTA